MADVPDLGTRRAFPDYLARRPAMAMQAYTKLMEDMAHVISEGGEIPFEMPPFGVLLYMEMYSIVSELLPPGTRLRITRRP